MQEGAVGAYWGVYDAARNTKFAFIEPIVRIPGWHFLAAISVGLAALLLGFFYIHSRSLAARGRSFLAVIVYATATAAVWIVYEYSQQYLTVTSVVVGSLLMIGMLGVIAVLLAEAHEWAEAHWVDFPSALAHSGARPPRYAQGVDPRAGAQRAAGDADRNARCPGSSRLPGL